MGNHPLKTIPGCLLDFAYLAVECQITANKTTKPTAGKAIEALRRTGILKEITGKRRDRVYAYQKYLNVLAEDTAIPRR